jgi:hypothetical protein
MLRIFIDSEWRIMIKERRRKLLPLNGGRIVVSEVLAALAVWGVFTLNTAVDPALLCVRCCLRTLSLCTLPLSVQYSVADALGKLSALLTVWTDCCVL